MPRPRKPTAILELNGAFKHDPQRRATRTNEPKVEGSPELIAVVPKHTKFEDLKLQCFENIVANMPLGVLGKNDSVWLSITCGLLAKEILGIITPPELGHLLKCLSKLGMNPADRSLVSAKQEKKGNAFADI